MTRWTSTRVAEAVGVPFPGTGVFRDRKSVV